MSSRFRDYALFVLALVCACSTNAELLRSPTQFQRQPRIADADYQTLIADTNRFDGALFEKLALTDENVVYSPASLYFALAMTYAGARQETAAQMAKVLSSLDPAVFHSGMNRATLELGSRASAPSSPKAGEKSVRIDLAHAAWAQRGKALAPEYLDLLGAQYNAGVFAIELANDKSGAAKAINRWVSEHTSGKITDLVQPSAIDSHSPWLLTSTLYFWGSWANAFDPSATHPQQFLPLKGNPADVPMMHATIATGYAEADGYQVVALPYYGDRLSMWIVLPAPQRFAEVRALARGPWLQGLARRIKQERVQLTIPRFQFAWGGSLKAPLSSLGMESAFSPAADFTGISKERGVFIGDVLSRTFIAVGEAGTEAVSASAVIAKSGPDESLKQFAADSPFLFWVRDETGLTLLHGQVTSLGPQ